MRAAIVYDAHADAPGAAPDVAGVLETVDAVAAALMSLGHGCVRIGASATGNWMHALETCAVDVVFNLCEGLDGDAAAEADAARAIAASDLPFTGADAEALALARRKDRVNLLLQSRLPVPRWVLVDETFDTQTDWTHFPAIVKPAGEDAGIGIGQSAVVHDAAELERALHDARAHVPLLAQQFLDGVELVVGFVGDTALPVAQIDYSAMPPQLPRVVGYAAKWNTGSVEDTGTRVVCPAGVTPRLAQQAIETAHTAWRAIARRGYGRVDLRADAHGVLHVLDVNPNADLAPSAGLARMAHVAGWSYTELVERILDDALSAVHA
ncbi:MAG TPA: hypothetical protein VFU06_16885 [Longimicrobiales bacterium]|nr:hypothetical protein [Longimicrobiales bacterium]